MPDNISKPDVSLSIITSSTLQENQTQRVLLIGQQLAAGTATSGALIQNIANDSDSISTLFGSKSLIANMVRVALAELDGIVPQPQIDVIPLDDNGTTTKATCVITFTDAPTEDGTITLKFGSESYTYVLDIVDADTVTTIAGKLTTAITADTEAPFTAANTAGVSTITASNGGTIPNTWGISISGSVAGLGVAITTGWASGVGNPTITSLFDVVEGIRYQTVVFPQAYDRDELTGFLDGRFNTANYVLDGVGILVSVDSLADLETEATALGSESVVLFGNKEQTATSLRTGGAMLALEDEMASQIAVVRALRLTEGAPITQFVSSSGGALDAFGGLHISSKPYFNTIIPEIPIAESGTNFSNEDQDELNANGVSVLGANLDFTNTVLGETVTSNISDSSFHFLNTIDQSSGVREFYFNNLKSNYESSRLTEGFLIPGLAMANIASVRSFCVLLYEELASRGVTQAGREAVEDYKDNLTITADYETGTMTIIQKPLLVSQVRAFLGTIEINFGG